MAPDLPERAQILYDRFKHFPEIRHQGGNVLMRGDAFVAFLDMRQLLEREIFAALHELRSIEQRSKQAPGTIPDTMAEKTAETRGFSRS